MNSSWLKILVIIALLVATLLSLRIATNLDPDLLSQGLDFMVNKDTGPIWFILLMALLPSVGFPISLFLVLAGIKFGFFWGLVLTALCIPIHLLITFALAKTLVYQVVSPILNRYGRNPPQIPPNQAAGLTALFVAIPGPPYALKNYLLAASGSPFSTYILVCWPINLALAVPFIGIGNSAFELNVPMLLAFIALLIGISLLVRYLNQHLKKRTRTKSDPDTRH